jgi:hypothetical protein
MVVVPTTTGRPSLSVIWSDYPCALNVRQDARTNVRRPDAGREGTCHDVLIQSPLPGAAARLLSFGLLLICGDGLLQLGER